MLHITISCAGKLDKPYWKQACDTYIKRLSPYCRLAVSQVDDGAYPKWFEKCHPVALCPEGDTYTSEEFAQLLQSWQNRGVSSICFYIGGSDGLERGFTERCGHTLSLSSMTWPHAVARVLLLEQLYRGFQILGNTSYHK